MNIEANTTESYIDESQEETRQSYKIKRALKSAGVFIAKDVPAHAVCCGPAFLAAAGFVPHLPHNPKIEIGGGLALMAVVQEGMRQLNKSTGGHNHSRLRSYAVSVPLFLASYWAIHEFANPHGCHDHDHGHTNGVHVHSEACEHGHNHNHDELNDQSFADRFKRDHSEHHEHGPDCNHGP